LTPSSVPTPLFGRAVPTTWWAWPLLVVSSVLSGLLLATYVRGPGGEQPVSATIDRRRLVGQLACPAPAPATTAEPSERLSL
jgi:hypothetical protein